jgi:hypothetical protein
VQYISAWHERESVLTPLSLLYIMYLRTDKLLLVGVRVEVKVEVEVLRNGRKHFKHCIYNNSCTQDTVQYKDFDPDPELSWGDSDQTSQRMLLLSACLLLAAAYGALWCGRLGSHWLLSDAAKCIYGLAPHPLCLPPSHSFWCFISPTSPRQPPPYLHPPIYSSSVHRSSSTSSTS